MSPVTPDKSRLSSSGSTGIPPTRGNTRFLSASLFIVAFLSAQLALVADEDFFGIFYEDGAATDLQFSLPASASASASRVLRQLEEYEDGHRQTRDRNITLSRDRLQKALEAQQEKAQRAGDLDALLAIEDVLVQLKTLPVTAPPTIPKDLPADSRRLLKGQSGSEQREERAMASTIQKKRARVVAFLDGIVVDLTRSGKIEQAKLLRGHIIKLQQGIKVAPQADNVTRRLPMVENKNFQPGLLAYEFPQLSTQTLEKEESINLPPDKLGKPIGATECIKEINGWQYDPSRNGVAIGYLKIETPGNYEFVADSFYDRNAVYVKGLKEPLCKYRDRTTINKINLKSGMVPFMAVGYVYARGRLTTVKWKVPGAEEFAPIPGEALFHVRAEAEERFPARPENP